MRLAFPLVLSAMLAGCLEHVEPIGDPQERAEQSDTGTASGPWSPSPRVMPLGDSITASSDGRASYRYWLWQSFEGEIDLVGSKNGVAVGGEPRFTDFDGDHEGHFGATTTEIAGRIHAMASWSNPDIVIVHLGTNDGLLGIDERTSMNELTHIVQTVRDGNPEAGFVLARIIPNDRVPEHADRFNAALDSLIVQLDSPSSPIYAAHCRVGFDPDRHTYDGVHPNETGERHLAACIGDALELHLP